MKVLVTGSRGFIGQKLVERLNSEKVEVWTLDTSGEGKNHIREDVAKFQGYHKFDIIYHLAAISNPRKCEEKKSKAWMVNVNGTKNILDQITEDQKIVFTSSAHVYGKNTYHNKEESSHRNPDNFYGLTKKVSEDLIRYICEEEEIDYTIFRLFNVYGPNQPKGFLVPDVEKKVKEQDQVAVIDSEAKISPIFIEDVLDVLSSDLPNGTYNVCNECLKISEIYEAICSKYDAVSKLDPDGVGGASVLCGDNSKISLYKDNWVEFEEGIEKL